MSAFVDARSLPTGTVLTPDLVIVGGGPAGITLAMALAQTKLDILLLESGGANFDPAVQGLYSGSHAGDHLCRTGRGRMRFLGGGTNHWGGWCRPLDPQDFEKRDWVPYSGWPFGQEALAPHYPRAQELVEAGPWLYDKGDSVASAKAPMLQLGQGGIYTSWFQFSKMRNDVLPTRFGTRYEADIKNAANVKPLLNVNVTGIRLSPDARRVERLDAATLEGKRFTVRPRHVVLATGGMENARLLLASNDVMKAGVGNQNDLVGRFFGDNPIPRDVATLVSFAGKPGPYYSNNLNMGNGAVDAGGVRAHRRFRARAQGDGIADHPGTSGGAGRNRQSRGADHGHGAGRRCLGRSRLFAGLRHGADARSRTAPDLDGRERCAGAATPATADAHRRCRFHPVPPDPGRAGAAISASKVGMLRFNCTRREDWLKNMDWGHHHLGTTRMHDDPKQGVVDADCKVHGIANLFVAGSAVFPTYGASNPTLNLLALTLRLADHLKKVTA